ncbi:MAG: GGDEF domain-containing protein [Vulcanococcus sp.]
MAPFPNYPIPADEEQRLRDLQRHGLLDTAADPHVQRIVDLTGSVLAMPIALVSLVDRQRQWFLAARGLAARETPREMAFCAHTIGGDGVLMVPDALEDERFSGNPLVQGEPRIRFYAGAPLRSSSGHNLGTLCVIDQRPRRLSGEQLGLLQRLADLVMRELELRRRSSLCPVTGLHTRSSFFELGEQEWQEARRRGRPLALLTFDIDDFRQINNRWGHEAGDQVLLDVCDLIRQRARPQDLVGRIGDEEFAVLLPECSPEEALAFAEGLRAAVAAMPGVFSHSDYQPQISGGLTSLSVDDRSFADLFYRADQALYLAKGNGRNQIARLVVEEPVGDGQP